MIKKPKSVKLLGTAKSVIGFSHESPLNIQIEEEKKRKTSSKKGKKSEVRLEKSISPSDIRNLKYLSSTKSIAGLRSIKAPPRKLKKNESSDIKDLVTSESDQKLKALSPKNTKQASLLMKSSSPLESKASSPLHNPALLIQNFPSLVITNSSQKYSFKNFDIKDELDLNTKVFQKKIKYKANTCLENVFAIDEKIENSRNFENSLRLCTKILRDIIIRMDWKRKK